MTFTKQLTDKLCKKRVVYSVTNVRGLCSNSCSPSDQWILTAKTSHGPKKLFMKVFFHSHECMHEDVQKACDALEYERKVYENILPMTHYQFFPVFWRAETNITFDELLLFLCNKIVVKKKKLKKSEISQRLLRNMKFMFEYDVNRPSLQSSNLLLKKDEMSKLGFLKKLKCQYLLIESFVGGVHSLYSMLYCKHLQSEYEFWTVIHQVACAIEALHKVKLQHNDLHYDNVMIQQKKTIYTRNNNRYQSPFKVFVFDFDRAYSSELGPNNINDEYFEENYGICNKFTEMSDLLYLTQCVSAIIGNSGILRMMSKSKDYSDQMDQIFETFVEAEDTSYVLNHLPKYFDNFEAIIKKIEEYMQFRKLKHRI